jgi:hypothetical protein
MVVQLLYYYNPRHWWVNCLTLNRYNHVAIYVPAKDIIVNCSDHESLCGLFAYVDYPYNEQAVDTFYSRSEWVEAAIEYSRTPLRKRSILWRNCVCAASLVLTGNLWNYSDVRLSANRAILV